MNKHLKNEGSFGSDCNRERIYELLGNNAMRSSTPVKAGFYFSPVLSIQNLEKWGGEGGRRECQGEEIATTLLISQFKLFICNSVNIYNNTCCYSHSCLYEVAVFG